MDRNLLKYLVSYPKINARLKPCFLYLISFTNNKIVTLVYQKILSFKMTIRIIIIGLPYEEEQGEKVVDDNRPVLEFFLVYVFKCST